MGHAVSAGGLRYMNGPRCEWEGYEYYEEQLRQRTAGYKQAHTCFTNAHTRKLHEGSQAPMGARTGHKCGVPSLEHGVQVVFLGDSMGGLQGLGWGAWGLRGM